MGMWWFLWPDFFLSVNFFFECLGTSALVEAVAMVSGGGLLDAGAAVALTNDNVWAKMHIRVGVLPHFRKVVSYPVAFEVRTEILW